jgi:spoIIIJ-associated protein
MDTVEAEGRSIDDAIERALQRLGGVSRDKVDIEIVSNATRGLFGLGGKRARVRARLRAPIAAAAGGGRDGRRETGDGSDRPAPPSARVPDRPALAGGGERDRRRETGDGSSPTGPPAARRTDRARPAPRVRDEKSPRRSTANTLPSPVSRLPSRQPPPAAAVARAQEVLTEIVRLTGVGATVAVATDSDGVRLVIDGDPGGVLIGRRGQTLDAIEYLVNRIVAHDEEGAVPLVVDAQDYRARRRQSLEALAQRLAERARRRGKPVTLNPMSPRDRRIVHLALQADPTLSTRSAGNGYYRKLVIVPAGSRRR